MTTAHGPLVVGDGENNDLFTYRPERGVMLGLGDFDDRPRAYTPKSLAPFDASIEELAFLAGAPARQKQKNQR
jgi:hypothetical protein